jgi:hypothetical protein
MEVTAGAGSRSFLGAIAVEADVSEQSNIIKQPTAVSLSLSLERKLGME